MMLHLVTMIAAQAASATTVEPPPVVPTDLRALPSLPWRTPPEVTPDVAAFVANEITAGRCPSLVHPLELSFAVLVRADGLVRTVIPKAIDCPTVEQFGAGLVMRFARRNLRSPAAGWYRASLTVAWSR